MWIAYLGRKGDNRYITKYPTPFPFPSTQVEMSYWPTPESGAVTQTQMEQLVAGLVKFKVNIVGEGHTQEYATGEKEHAAEASNLQVQLQAATELHR